MGTLFFCCFNLELRFFKCILLMTFLICQSLWRCINALTLRVALWSPKQHWYFEKRPIRTGKWNLPAPLLRTYRYKRRWRASTRSDLFFGANIQSIHLYKGTWFLGWCLWHIAVAILLFLKHIIGWKQTYDYIIMSMVEPCAFRLVKINKWKAA